GRVRPRLPDHHRGPARWRDADVRLVAGVEGERQAPAADELARTTARDLARRGLRRGCERKPVGPLPDSRSVAPDFPQHELAARRVALAPRSGRSREGQVAGWQVTVEMPTPEFPAPHPDDVAVFEAALREAVALYREVYGPCLVAAYVIGSVHRGEA